MQYKGERRPARRSTPASLGVAGFWLLSQRSGAAYRLQCKFCDALAECETKAWSRGVAGVFLPRSTLEVGAEAATALGPASAAGSHEAWVPDESLDDRSHCGIDWPRVRSSVPSGSCRTLNAQSELEPTETRTTRPRKKRRGHRALETEALATNKKNAARLGAHLVFADESGFLLIPHVPVRSGSANSQWA